MNSKSTYANAVEILPSELVKEIQKYHCGLIWVPSPSVFYRERKDLVVSLSKKQMPSKEIANLAGVSRRRVNQILRANRQSEEICGK
jgi:predicted transcriptional regulator